MACREVVQHRATLRCQRGNMADSDKLPTDQTANSVPKSAENMNEQDPNVGKDEGGVPAKQPILPTAGGTKAFQAVRVFKFLRSGKKNPACVAVFNKSQVIPWHFDP